MDGGQYLVQLSVAHSHDGLSHLAFLLAILGQQLTWDFPRICLFPKARFFSFFTSLPIISLQT